MQHWTGLVAHCRNSVMKYDDFATDLRHIRLCSCWHVVVLGYRTCVSQKAKETLKIYYNEAASSGGGGGGGGGGGREHHDVFVCCSVCSCLCLCCVALQSCPAVWACVRCVRCGSACAVCDVGLYWLWACVHVRYNLRLRTMREGSVHHDYFHSQPYHPPTFAPACTAAYLPVSALTPVQACPTRSGHRARHAPCQRQPSPPVTSSPARWGVRGRLACCLPPHG